MEIPSQPSRATLAAAAAVIAITIAAQPTLAETPKPQAEAGTSEAEGGEVEKSRKGMTIQRRVNRTIRAPINVLTGAARFSHDGKDGPHINTIKAEEVAATRARSSEATSDSTAGLAQQAENRRGARGDLIEIPSAERLIKARIARFAAVWPHAKPNPQKLRVVFQAGDAYNAFVLADDTMVISLGLIDVADADSELNYVIAHEYAHMLMGHHYKKETTDQQRRITNMAQTGFMIAAVASQTRVKKNAAGESQLALADRKKAAEGVARAAAYRDSVTFFIDSIYEPFWNRLQEDEADVLAVDLLVRSNTSMDAYDAVFQKLHDSREARHSLVSTLQTEAKSIIAKELTAENLIAAGLSDNPGSFVEGFRDTMVRQLRQSVLNWFVGIFKQTHRAPANRIDGVSNYITNAHGEYEWPEDEETLVTALRDAPDYKRASGWRDAYLKLDAAAKDSDQAEVAAQLKALGVATPVARPGMPAFIYHRAGNIARDRGDGQRARAYYNLARKAPLPSVELYRDYVDFLIEARELPQATAGIQEGSAAIGDPSAFLPQRIGIAIAKEDYETAAKLKEECRKAEQREKLIAACLAVYPDGDDDSNPLFKPFKGLMPQKDQPKSKAK